MSDKGKKIGLGIVKKKDREVVTVDSLKELFPAKKNTITEETVDLINKANNDPEFDGVSLVSSLVSLQNVMYKNSCSLDEYIRAVKFCAYLESENDSYIEAYKKTFYDREFVKNRMNLSPDSIQYKELASAASRYRRSAVVISVLTAADVPLYLMFQGYRYKAVQVLADRMENSKYDKDKISAAKALLENVKPPDNVKIDMEIGTSSNRAIEDLNDQLSEIASKQLKYLDRGVMSVSDLGKMKPKVIDVDAIEKEEIDE